MKNSKNISNTPVKILSLNQKCLSNLHIKKKNVNFPKLELNLITKSKPFEQNINSESFTRITTSTLLDSDENVPNEKGPESSIISKSMIELVKNKLENKEILSKMFEKIKFVTRFKKPTTHSKRMKILKKYNFLNQMSQCNTKFKMVQILHNSSHKWKCLLKNYLERVFLMHLHLRNIKDFSDLMSNREVLYKSITNPDILLVRFTLGNNVIKNFSKGFVNFVIMFHDDLIKQNFITNQLSN